MEDNKKDSSRIEQIMKKADGIIESTAKEVIEELKRKCRTYGELREKNLELHKWDGNKDRYEITKEVRQQLNEEIDCIPVKRVLYRCNGEKKGCSKSDCYKNGGTCRHTQDITCAESFYLTGCKNWMEDEKISHAEEAKGAMDSIQEKEDEIDYLKRRRERVIQDIGEEGFDRTVGSIMEALKKHKLELRPTVREDLFEYVEGIINL